MKKWAVVAGVVLLAMVIVGARKVQAGGWIVLTLESWPTRVVAGEPFTVKYALRGHGQELVSHEDTWMNTGVLAVHEETGERVTVESQWTGEKGYYEAEMTLPLAGTWQWRFDVFGSLLFTMPPLTVLEATAVSEPSLSPFTAVASSNVFSAATLVNGIGLGLIVLALVLWFRRRQRLAPVLGLLGVALFLAGFWLTSGTQTATAVAETTLPATAEMGEILFVAKGCVTCHRHDDVDFPGLERNLRTNVGPDLTNRALTPEFLRMWLNNPQDVRPGTQMPTLGLSDPEIEALTAFLTVAEDE